MANIISQDNLEGARDHRWRINFAYSFYGNPYAIFLSDVHVHVHFEDLVLTWQFIVSNAHALLPRDCFDLYACLAGIFIIISHYGVEN